MGGRAIKKGAMRLKEMDRLGSNCSECNEQFKCTPYGTLAPAMAMPE